MMFKDTPERSAQPVAQSDAAMLLDLIRGFSANRLSTRGFELAEIAIILRLTTAPDYAWTCSPQELSELCGLPRSTAMRIAQIMATVDSVIDLQMQGEALHLSLTATGMQYAADHTDQARKVYQDADWANAAT